MTKHHKKYKKSPRKSAQHSFDLATIKPITPNQRLAFEEYFNDQHLMLLGAAGTGKTFISLYLALNDIINHQSFKKVVVVRSAVPTRDMGFLPGSEQEKLAAYTIPYKQIVNSLFGRGDAFEILTKNRTIEVMSTSYIRGQTLEDCVVIFDECQNGSFHELDSVMTRIGENSRMIFSGDIRQSDLHKSGLKRFKSITDRIDQFSEIDFQLEDIVRSGLVREYLITKHKYDRGD